MRWRENRRVSLSFLPYSTMSLPITPSARSSEGEIESCVPSGPLPAVAAIVRTLLSMDPSEYATPVAFNKLQLRFAREHKMMVGKKELLRAYRDLHVSDPVGFPMKPMLRRALLKCAVRSASGIVNISVVMPGGRFSCKYNCKFCPNEPGMPRSYLSNEDAVARAASVEFDAVRQAHVRFDTLLENGHDVDKIEYRILGGTFSCYPHDVAITFLRDLYYAANTYNDEDLRERRSLAEEIAANATAEIHVVGVGVETRPDEICDAEIVRFREYGITRVELGVQHTSDDLLRRLGRGHGVAASRRAVRLLKDAGFKIEMHIMTDLPGATPEMDKECYRTVLQGDNSLLPDYLKDYPCLDVAFTEVKAMKERGEWTPYAEVEGGKLLEDVLIYRQQITPACVRVNRVQRDFRPACGANGGLGFTSATLTTDLGDRVHKAAVARGIYCQCIRCREVRGASYRDDEIKYYVHGFHASGGEEWFVSAEVDPQPNEVRPRANAFAEHSSAKVDRQPRSLLLGFIRVRHSAGTQTCAIPELRLGRTALVRELHVYGTVTSVGVGAATGTQHRGIGRRLLEMAEMIVCSHADRLAIIAGVGVRNYYKKFGYNLEGTYMVKTLSPPPVRNGARIAFVGMWICLVLCVLRMLKYI
jgi:ELP3 family radical SAM enzyme/protein acetyltransferase